jgi:radical SAM protein with 4Fe4S-binding SPASM domain
VLQQINANFNQNEYGKLPYHYCWSTSPIIFGYYVDYSLNTYRCVASVGNEKYKIGTIKNTNFDSFLRRKMYKNNLFYNAKCQTCQIGGFCGGGCSLEKASMRSLICKNEIKNFDRIIRNIVIKKIKYRL